MKMHKQQQLLSSRLIDFISQDLLFNPLTNSEINALDAWISRHYEALQMITLSDIFDLVKKYEQHL